MRKKIMFFLTLVFLLLFTSAFASAGLDTKSAEIQSFSVFNLPSGLKIIADEAFEGTAFTEVTLPESVITIGERTFANISGLRIIRIPVATKEISRTAFSGSNHVVISGPSDSYAKAWAKENRVPFSAIEVIYAGMGRTGIISVSFELRRFKGSIDSECCNKQKIYLQIRKLDDNAENYIIRDIISYHIQGRAPPFSQVRK